MANITAALVKELRERTGAGMMDCKKALVECDGDMDKAIDFLREKGLAAAAKKAGRIAAEGMVDTYVDENGVGVTVEVNCETDFVANTDRFKNLCRDFAKHIAAAAPDGDGGAIAVLELDIAAVGFQSQAVFRQHVSQTYIPAACIGGQSSALHIRQGNTAAVGMQLCIRLQMYLIQEDAAAVASCLQLVQPGILCPDVSALDGHGQLAGNGCG